MQHCLISTPASRGCQVANAASCCTSKHAAKLHPSLLADQVTGVLPALACCLRSIEFPVRRANGQIGRDTTRIIPRGENQNRPGTNLQTPGVRRLLWVVQVHQPITNNTDRWFSLCWLLTAQVDYLLTECTAASA
jgi:hypothetical protein